MNYNYELEKAGILTFEGFNALLRIEQECRLALAMHGAFTIESICAKLKLNTTWTVLACFDLLEEHGIIKCLSDSDVFAQHRVYARGLKQYKF